MFRSTFCIIVLFISLVVSQSRAQSLDEQLEKLAGAAGKAYVTPMVTNLGVNYNSAWMNRAPEKKRLGFDLEFGMVAMTSKIPEGESKEFSLNSSFRFNKSQAMELTETVTDATVRNELINEITSQDMDVRIAGATITGSAANKIKVYFSGKTFTLNSAFPVTVTLPGKEIDLGVGGLLGSVKSFPSAAPQLKLGTVFGTRAILRYLPETDLGDSLGKFSYSGFGLEHNLSYWLDSYLPMIPVDISAGFLTQTSKIGNTVEFASTTYGLNVSRKFGLWVFSITPYVGYAMESSTLSVNLVQKLETLSGIKETKISFDAEGEGKSRVTVGAYIKLFLLGLHVEYAAAKANTISGSLMFNF